MSPELTKRLVARHPALLAMPEDSVILQRGVECGDGWYDLIDGALTAIEKHCATVNAKPPAILQVKQKIGQLRIYFRPYDEIIRSIIDDAERKSAMTCEQCGRPGKLVKGPHIRVTCGRDHHDGRH